ncbi:beta-glucosidase family protein [Xanthomonas hortorum]|uniref:beta-glucosidase family protein n=1 Tax=Xanthomonas hortorum TaxID=56454 RepID=UPI0015932612|nr:glycoside hydrolase family 3 C-terminal domain-containing protein [Xanthomonas hortorum]
MSRTFPIATCLMLTLAVCPIQGSTSTAATKPQAGWLDASLSPDERAQLAVAAMTQAEKLQLVFGYATGEQATKGFTPPAGAYPGSAGFVPGIARLGLPPLWESDSGIGVSGVGPAAEQRQRTSLPSSLAIAASWDEVLAEKGGAMIGGQARASGFNVLLAGSAVLTREPRSGRNFENSGEDPWLNGVITGAQIRGVQSAGVISTLKHYAFNAQETGRTSMDARIDEAGARQSDYLATQIALERSHPGSVMCAYNKVNGVYSCENSKLVRMLKEEWGYRGFIMSDWGAVHSTVASANAGLDQQSGWPFDKERYFGDPLQKAIDRGEVKQARLDDMAERIVRSMAVAGVIDRPVAPEQPIDFEGDTSTSREIAEAGMVLLKNDQQLLPLARNIRSIAVIGGHADKGVLSGGGSAQVHPVGGNAVPGIEPLNWPGPVVYHPNPPLSAMRRLAPHATIEFSEGNDIDSAVKLARNSSIAVVFVTQWTAEARDAALELEGNQDALVAAVSAANPNTVVVIESGGPILIPWVDSVPVILESWFPGSGGGDAIANILFGIVNPSGRLPITFPRSLADLPRPVLDGVGLKPEAPFSVDYHEGAAVGYKWFDRTNRAPLFAFGHGLSYTRFGIDMVHVGIDGRTLTAQVRNHGKRAGQHVVQFYAHAPEGRWEAPKRLVGWSKVSLEPGKSKQVVVQIDLRLLARWTPTGWEIAKGTYRISAASSSDDDKGVYTNLEIREDVHLPARNKMQSYLRYDTRLPLAEYSNTSPIR